MHAVLFEGRTEAAVAGDALPRFFDLSNVTGLHCLVLYGKEREDREHGQGRKEREAKDDARALFP